MVPLLAISSAIHYSIGIVFICGIITRFVWILSSVATRLKCFRLELLYWLILTQHCRNSSSFLVSYTSFYSRHSLFRKLNHDRNKVVFLGYFAFDIGEALVQYSERILGALGAIFLLPFFTLGLYPSSDIFILFYFNFSCAESAFSTVLSSLPRIRHALIVNSLLSRTHFLQGSVLLFMRGSKHGFSCQFVCWTFWASHSLPHSQTWKYPVSSTDFRT